MYAPLVIEALNRILSHRQVEPGKLLIHTDEGSQYQATDYQDILESQCISCSISAKASSWDYAVEESFFLYPETGGEP